MKLHKKKRALVIAAVASVLLTGTVWGNVGSEADPLISLSYITNVVMPYIDNAVSGASMPQYTVIKMDKGAVLTAGASCDIILRSGEAVVRLGSGAAGGFTDVTKGADINNGEKPESNHHLICPRDDGRQIVAQTEVYIMVRGSYFIS